MINLLSAGRDIAENLTYVPKAGAGARTMQLVRSATNLGGKIKPLILRDTGYWSSGEYGEIVTEIGKKATHDWSAKDVPRKEHGVSTLGDAIWTSIRGQSYKNTEMIGVMVVVLEYAGARDFLVSAAPNVLFKQPTTAAQGTGYMDHRKSGDNKGNQIHAEMTFAAQLKELITQMKARDETPAGQFQRRRGLSAGTLSVDVDILIEKNSLCPGCGGTWETFDGWMTAEGHTLRYRMI